MNPVRVLQLVRSLGGDPGWLRVVGCEPAVLETEDGAMGLSETVQAAVAPAIEMIEVAHSRNFQRDRNPVRHKRFTAVETISRIE